MINNVICPHCRGSLQVDPTFAGRAVKCVHCGGTFIAPDASGDSADAGDSLPMPIILMMIVGGHILAMLFLGMMIGLGRSATLVLLIGAAEIAVWQRQRLSSWFQQVRESETTRRLAQRGRDRVASLLQPRGLPSGPDCSSRTEPRGTHEPVEAQKVAGPGNVLLEIQIAEPSRRGREAIPSPPVSWHPHSRSETGSPLNVDLPQDRVLFFGPGTYLDLGRGMLKDSLVYATGAAYEATFDASLIDATLPVAPPSPPHVEDLPYWPSYYESSPEQRSRYLDWLVGGRCDPDIELGYVFIYFYGLEHRIIVDGADHLPIAQEITRLYGIYRRSNSFRNYASSLLWLTLLLAGRQQAVPESFLAKALQVTERWNEETLGLCLAYYHQHSESLPPEVAFVAAQHDPRSRSSVIVKRHSNEFQELFNKKFQAKFGDRMAVKASKRPKKIAYRPASGTLLRSSGYEDAFSLGTMSHVLAISSQFKALLAIWEECIGDLQAYNRVHRAAGETEMTTEAYEALPEELRDGSHPEEDAWMGLWQEYADEDGWPLIPVSRLAGLRGIPRRDKLTKAQCNRLLKTADTMGIGLEPDTRLTGRSYRWNERVSPFFSETDASEDMIAYNAAAVLLRLGLSIAEADGQVDEDELALITEHLEEQFNLSVNQSKRLEQLKYLLLHSEAADKTVSNMLKKRLPHHHRLLLGNFLVAIAAADQIVTKDEIRALKKAYRALGLEPGELDELLCKHAIDDGQPQAAEPQEFRLDRATITGIIDDTGKVAEILREAMAADEEDEESSFAVPASISTVGTSEEAESQVAVAMLEPEPIRSGPTPETDELAAVDLHARFRPFLNAIVKKEQWTQEELKALAREHNVMLNGAIGAINNWSRDRYDDWLIEERDPVTIQIHLIEEDP